MTDQGLVSDAYGILQEIVCMIYMFIDHVKWIIARFSSCPLETYTCLVGKTAIITGGSSGLGYELSRMLASRGCKVIIATNVECESERNNLIATTKNPNIITKYLDLGSFASIRKFVEDIRKTETKIDFLVNNAGVAIKRKYCSEDGLNSLMQINYLGHFLLTHLLIDELKAASSARVVFYASSASYFQRMTPHEINQLPKNGKRSAVADVFSYYANSKLCTIVAAQELGERLSKYGILVNSVDPGIIHTSMVQEVLNLTNIIYLPVKLVFHLLMILYSTDVCRAVKNTMYTLTGENVTNGGHYFQGKPIHKPHNLNNSDFCKQIWAKSEELVLLKNEEKLK